MTSPDPNTLPEPTEGLRRLGAALVNLFPAWEVRLSGRAECPLSEARRAALRMGGDATPRLFLADSYESPLAEDGAGRWALAAMRPHGRLPFSLTAGSVIGCSWIGEALDRLTEHKVDFRWPDSILVGGEDRAIVRSERIGAALAVAASFDRPFIDTFAGEIDETQANPTYLMIAATLLENFENPAPGRVALENYRKRCGTLGGVVQGRSLADDSLGSKGEAVGVTLDGDLILRTDEGDRAALNPTRNALA